MALTREIVLRKSVLMFAERVALHSIRAGEFYGLISLWRFIVVIKFNISRVWKSERNICGGCPAGLNVLIHNYEVFAVFAKLY